MDLELSTWMMIAFIAGLLLSIWKMYSFMPTKKLADDDTGEDIYEILVDIMHAVLRNFEDAPEPNALHDAMKKHENFDEKKLWRFNQNKLKQLLNKYYLHNKHLSSVEDIHADVHSKKN